MLDTFLSSGESKWGLQSGDYQCLCSRKLARIEESNSGLFIMQGLRYCCLTGWTGRDQNIPPVE
jgi:hypothetical protein